MYALRSNHLAAFIFDPNEGIDFPILIEFDQKHIYVEVPEISEIESDFDVFDTIDELRDAVGNYAEDVAKAMEIGRFYSRHFATQIARDDLPLHTLNQMICDHQSSPKQPAGRHLTARIQTKSYTFEDREHEVSRHSFASA